MGIELSSELVARLKARAAKAEERSDTASMTAQSVGIDEMLAAQRESYASQSPEFQKEMREYLEGMNSPLAGMISNAVTGDGSQASGLLGALGNLLGGQQMFAMAGGDMIRMSGSADPGEAPAPAGEEAVAAAEAELGFVLPGDLRHFYTDVANGGVGPGDGVYDLDQLVAKWREMTHEPAGPDEEEWPQKLLPIHGRDWDLTCIDRETGKLVYFDAEEIEYGGWDKAFKEEADSFEAWLHRWFG